MENSQKALLIAGAILLSILIISIGIYMFTISNDSVDLSTIDALALQVANSEFEQYRGKQVGRVVITLLDKVIQYNKDFAQMENYSIGICSNDSRVLSKISNPNAKKALTQSIQGRKSGVYYEDNIKSIKNAIGSTQYFNIWYDYNDLNGYIYIMHIDAPKS